MLLQLEDIIVDLKEKLCKEKSIRNTVWLKTAIHNLEEYAKAKERKHI